MRLVTILVLALTVFGSFSRGEDRRAEESDLDPFGIPTPRDLDKPGTIVLHGGGPITQDVFDEFIERAGGANAKIVFIPSAGWQADGFDTTEDFEDALAFRFSSWTDLVDDGGIAGFHFLYTDDPDDADDPDFLKPLETATGVWFSGGDQSELNYRFVGEYPEQTRFQKLLKRVLRRGGVVGGTSAGMAAIPMIMTLWQDRDDQISPFYAVAGHGLGLLENVIVEQHFDTRGGRLERFTSLLKDADRLDALAGREGVGATMIGIAVEEDAAAVLHKGELRVMGEGRVHLFRKTRDGRVLTWEEIPTGETVEIDLVEPHGSERP